MVETNPPPNDCHAAHVTLATLSVKIEALTVRMLERFEAFDRRIVIASDALSTWKEEHNHLLDQLRNSYGEKLSRMEYTAAHEALIEKAEAADRLLNNQLEATSKRIGTVEHRLAILEGKSTGIGTAISGIVSAIALLLATISAFSTIHWGH